MGTPVNTEALTRLERRRSGACRVGLRAWVPLLLVMVCGVATVSCGDLVRAIGGNVPWEVASPESQGLDAAALDSVTEILAAHSTTAFLVVRRNKIAHEWYALGHGVWRKEGVASLAKSLVGSMALLLVLSDELMELDDSAAKYIPQWRDDPLRSRITIRQLASHSSGIEHGKDGDLGNWREIFWNRERDLFSAVIENARPSSVPGTSFEYSGPAYAALAVAITRSLQGTAHPTLETLLEERMMEPVGVPRSAWSISYGGRAYRVDGMKLYAVWSGARFTARAAARVGQLMLQKGRWSDSQVVDSAWAERAVSYAGAPLPDSASVLKYPAPALGWWVNANGVWAALPHDAFAGVGAGGQVVLVVPSWDLVVVRFGEAPDDAHSFPGVWTFLDRVLFTPLGNVLESGHLDRPPGYAGKPDVRDSQSGEPRSRP